MNEYNRQKFEAVFQNTKFHQYRNNRHFDIDVSEPFAIPQLNSKTAVILFGRNIARLIIDQPDDTNLAPFFEFSYNKIHGFAQNQIASQAAIISGKVPHYKHVKSAFSCIPIIGKYVTDYNPLKIVPRELLSLGFPIHQNTDLDVVVYPQEREVFVRKENDRIREICAYSVGPKKALLKAA